MANADTDLRQYVEGGDGILCIRASQNCRDWNGIQYKPGMSSKNVGSSKLSMNVATIPPGGGAEVLAWRQNRRGNANFRLATL